MPHGNMMGGGGSQEAIKWLKRAIDLHEGHMTGEVPTDENSQAELMYDLKSALEGLASSSPMDMKMDMEKEL